MTGSQHGVNELLFQRKHSVEVHRAQDVSRNHNDQPVISPGVQPCFTPLKPVLEKTK